MTLSRRNPLLLLIWPAWLAAVSPSAVTLVPQNGHSGAVTKVGIEHNSGLLVSSGEDGSVRLWNLKDGLLVRVIHAHAGAVRALALDPRGQFIATAGVDLRVCLWEIASGSRLWERKEDGTGTISLA